MAISKDKKIELTSAEFTEISADVAANICAEADKHGVSGTMVALLTALFCAKLHTALFDKEKLEVEDGRK